MAFLEKKKVAGLFKRRVEKTKYYKGREENKELNTITTDLIFFLLLQFFSPLIGSSGTGFFSSRKKFKFIFSMVVFCSLNYKLTQSQRFLYI